MSAILSVLALGGDVAASTQNAAIDFHAALFQVCHAGQNERIKSTLSTLSNKGKAGKIRVVVSGFADLASAFRLNAKQSGKLEKNGAYKGLGALDLPWSIEAITSDFAQAVAVIPKTEAQKLTAAVKKAAKASNDKAAEDGISANDRRIHNDQADELVHVGEANTKLVAENKRLLVLVAMLQATNDGLTAIVATYDAAKAAKAAKAANAKALRQAA